MVHEPDRRATDAPSILGIYCNWREALWARGPQYPEVLADLVPGLS